MRILPIIARLKDQCPLLDGRVEPAQSLTALSDEEMQYDLPIAFVYAGKETASDSDVINAVSQLSPRSFSILIAAKNSDGESEPLEDIRDQIKTALLGYQIDEEHDHIAYAEGDVIDVSKRLIWWKDTFETWVLLRSI